MLMVRLEEVPEVPGELQIAGLIHCSRGHIAVLDRPDLDPPVSACDQAIGSQLRRPPRDVVARNPSSRLTAYPE